MINNVTSKFKYSLYNRINPPVIYKYIFQKIIDILELHVSQIKTNEFLKFYYK